MLPIRIGIVADKTPKWLEPVKNGTSKLSIYYLTGMDTSPGGAPTRKKPPVQALRGPIQRHWYDHGTVGDAIFGLEPPHQPRAIAIEGHNLSVEDVLRSWMDTFQGVGGLKLTPIKLFENFAYSEASQLHGNMLQKESFQKNQAKELLTTIQNIKTAILNIETDLEKLNEQRTAFKDGDWEKIKWLFIDNYGGPDRSWTAIARQVPLVRMSMTWFLRLKTKERAPFKEYFSIKMSTASDAKEAKKLSKKSDELGDEIKRVSKINKKDQLKQIDDLVKAEQMNPAIANHLKSKVEEFWNWVTHYSSWIRKSRDRVMANLIYQKTNLKMYMKWAADAIHNAQRLKMDASTMESLIPDFSFRHTPREMTSMEYIFAADRNRPEIMERCRPWIPMILTHIDVVSTVELQKKFAGVSFLNMCGYMRKDDYAALVHYLNKGSNNLVKIMVDSGAMSEMDIRKIFDVDELKVLKGESEGTVKFDNKEKVRMEKVKLATALTDSLKILGIDFKPNKNNIDWTYNLRAAGYANELLNRGLEMFKKANGCFTFE